MFVQCVVASELIRVCNGVKCGGAMFRDASVYMLGITCVLIAFALGQVSVAAVIVCSGNDA